LSCGTEIQSRPGNFAGAATTPKEKGTSTMTTATAADTVKFAVGATYYVRSIGDHNCIWRFAIVRRTASSVWVSEIDGDRCAVKVERRKVSGYNGRETFKPFGVYSMSPTVFADNVADGLADRRDW